MTSIADQQPDAGRKLKKIPKLKNSPLFFEIKYFLKVITSINSQLSIKRTTSNKLLFSSKQIGPAIIKTESWNHKITTNTSGTQIIKKTI